jgi:hypothetical protein
MPRILWVKKKDGVDMKQFYNVDLERETVQYIGRFSSWDDANEHVANRIAEEIFLEDEIEYDFCWIVDRQALEAILTQGCWILEETK